MYTKLIYFIVIAGVSYAAGAQEKSLVDRLPDGPVAAYQLFDRSQQSLQHTIQVYTTAPLKNYRSVILTIKNEGDSGMAERYRDTFQLPQPPTGIVPQVFTLKVNKQHIQQSYRNFIGHYGQLPTGNYLLETYWLDDTFATVAADRQLLLADSIMPEAHPVFMQFKKYYAAHTKGKRYIQPERVVRRFFQHRKETFFLQEGSGYKDIHVYFEGHLAGIIRLEGNERKPEIAVPALVRPSLGGKFEGILAVSRKKNSNTSEQKEVKGNINIQHNFSNQQEVYADFRNAYYDVAGTVNVPVMGLPVTVDGYYTRQDKYRTLKSSYINVSFDKDAYLRQLEEANKTLRSAYTETAVDNMMLGDYYKNQVQQLKAEKATYIEKVKLAAKDTMAGTYRENVRSNPPDTSIQGYTGAYETAEQRYREAEQRLEALEKKIEKAELLARQLEKKRYIDSVEVLSRFRKEDIGNMDSKDYMSVLEHTFPNNKMLSRLKRLNGFNIGGFSNQVSRYTNPGQLTRGGSFSYDLNYVDVAVSLGRMDRVNFGGEKEKFNVGSVQVMSGKLKHQQIGVIFYHAANNNAGTQSGTGGAESAPAQPADNIYTMVYKLAIPVLDLQSEYAYSDQKRYTTPTPMLHQASFNINAGVQLMKDKIRLAGCYEYTGKHFSNRSLYYNIKGLAMYNLKLTSFWFRNTVKADVEYHVLNNVREQQTGTNKKYGFELQTLSRRYPRMKIAYKPFTTFSTVQDTVANFSYTLLGNVLLAQADYQYKRKQTVMSTGLHYNRSYSELDTVQYAGSIWSFHYNITHKGAFVSLNVGRSDIRSNIINPMQLLMNNNTFGMLQGNYQVLPQLTVGGGWNGGWNGGRLTKYGGRVSVSTTHRRSGCTLYVNAAINRYNIENKWERLYHITSGIIIPFQFTLK